MFSWQYNEKIMKDIIYNHAYDFGKFYCELMMDSPKVYKEFMKGFHDELGNRIVERAGTGGNDSEPPEKDVVP